MEVTLALLADHANVTADGKLNLLGVFDVISADRFPIVHPSLSLVLRFAPHPAVIGTTTQGEIRLITENGQTLLSVPLDDIIHSQLIVGFQSVRFETPGPYWFAVLINGETRKTVPLQIQQRTPPPAIPG